MSDDSPSRHGRSRLGARRTSAGGTLQPPRPLSVASNSSVSDANTNTPRQPRSTDNTPRKSATPRRSAAVVAAAAVMAGGRRSMKRADDSPATPSRKRESMPAFASKRQSAAAAAADPGLRNSRASVGADLGHRKSGAEGSHHRGSMTGADQKARMRSSVKRAAVIGRMSQGAAANHEALEVAAAPNPQLVFRQNMLRRHVYSRAKIDLAKQQAEEATPAAEEVAETTSITPAPKKKSIRDVIRAVVKSTRKVLFSEKLIGTFVVGSCEKQVRERISERTREALRDQDWDRFASDLEEIREEALALEIKYNGCIDFSDIKQDLEIACRMVREQRQASAGAMTSLKLLSEKMAGIEDENSDAEAIWQTLLDGQEDIEEAQRKGKELWKLAVVLSCGLSVNKAKLGEEKALADAAEENAEKTWEHLLDIDSGATADALKDLPEEPVARMKSMFIDNMEEDEREVLDYCTDELHELGADAEDTSKYIHCIRTEAFKGAASMAVDKLVANIEQTSKEFVSLEEKLEEHFPNHRPITASTERKSSKQSITPRKTSRQSSRRSSRESSRSSPRASQSKTSLSLPSLDFRHKSPSIAEDSDSGFSSGSDKPASSRKSLGTDIGSLLLQKRRSSKEMLERFVETELVRRSTGFTGKSSKLLRRGSTGGLEVARRSSSESIQADSGRVPLRRCQSAGTLGIDPKESLSVAGKKESEEAPMEEVKSESSLPQLPQLVVTTEVITEDEHVGQRQTDNRRSSARRNSGGGRPPNQHSRMQLPTPQVQRSNSICPPHSPLLPDMPALSVKTLVRPEDKGCNRNKTKPMTGIGHLSKSRPPLPMALGSAKHLADSLLETASRRGSAPMSLPSVSRRLERADDASVAFDMVTNSKPLFSDNVAMEIGNDLCPVSSAPRRKASIITGRVAPVTKLGKGLVLEGLREEELAICDTPKARSKPPSTLVDKSHADHDAVAQRTRIKQRVSALADHDLLAQIAKKKPVSLNDLVDSSHVDHEAAAQRARAKQHAHVSPIAVQHGQAASLGSGHSRASQIGILHASPLAMPPASQHTRDLSCDIEATNGSQNEHSDSQADAEFFPPTTWTKKRMTHLRKKVRNVDHPSNGKGTGGTAESDPKALDAPTSPEISRLHDTISNATDLPESLNNLDAGTLPDEDSSDSCPETTAHGDVSEMEDELVRNGGYDLACDADGSDSNSETCEDNRRHYGPHGMSEEWPLHGGLGVALAELREHIQKFLMVKGEAWQEMAERLMQQSGGGSICVVTLVSALKETGFRCNHVEVCALFQGIGVDCSPERATLTGAEFSRLERFEHWVKSSRQEVREAACVFRNHQAHRILMESITTHEQLVADVHLALERRGMFATRFDTACPSLAEALDHCFSAACGMEAQDFAEVVLSRHGLHIFVSVITSQLDDAIVSQQHRALAITILSMALQRHSGYDSMPACETARETSESWFASTKARSDVLQLGLEQLTQGKANSDALLPHQLSSGYASLPRLRVPTPPDDFRDQQPSKMDMLLADEVWQPLLRCIDPDDDAPGSSVPFDGPLFGQVLAFLRQAHLPLLVVGPVGAHLARPVSAALRKLQFSSHPSACDSLRAYFTGQGNASSTLQKVLEALDELAGCVSAAAVHKLAAAFGGRQVLRQQLAQLSATAEPILVERGRRILHEWCDERKKLMRRWVKPMRKFNNLKLTGIKNIVQRTDAILLDDDDEPLAHPLLSQPPPLTAPNAPRTATLRPTPRLQLQGKYSFADGQLITWLDERMERVRLPVGYRCGTRGTSRGTSRGASRGIDTRGASRGTTGFSRRRLIPCEKLPELRQLPTVPFITV